MLKSILNTGLSAKNGAMFGQTFGTQSTYLTTDFGKKVYKQKNSVTHAEDRLFDSETIKAIAKNGIWLNNSPCPRCARKIMNQYHDYPNPEDKPTIYIQSVYVGNGGLDSTLNSLMCLAKMLNEGFDIQPWDWNAFKDELGNQKCIDAIDTALVNQAFLDKRNKTEKAINYLKDVQDCVQDDWCQ